MPAEDAEDIKVRLQHKMSTFSDILVLLIPKFTGLGVDT